MLSLQNGTSGRLDDTCGGDEQDKQSFADVHILLHASTLSWVPTSRKPSAQAALTGDNMVI